MSNQVSITPEDFNELMEHFRKNSYTATQNLPDSLNFKILQICESLFKCDYKVIELDNSNGKLTTNYPATIFIPERELDHKATTCASGGSTENESKVQNFVTFGADMPERKSGQQPQSQTLTPTPQQPQSQPHRTIYEHQYDFNRIQDICSAKYARCRQRFVVPVIMCRGQYICRSATVANQTEATGRALINTYINRESDNNVQVEEDKDDKDDNSVPLTRSSYNEAIRNDVKLLNALNVGTIVDLMVEKEKVKFCLSVTLSEKACDDDTYKDFIILGLPYPGCEFFKEFHYNNYMAKGIYYDWTKGFNNASLLIPEPQKHLLDIDWTEYKTWDLMNITRNYMRLILKCINDEDSGMLIHCISGWDRTPLFISLVRLSLWADGLAHESLEPIQIAYLTLAYDWYLFGHQLPCRLKREEDIMLFSFHALKLISGDEFAVGEGRRKRAKTSSSNSSNISGFKAEGSDEDLKDDMIIDQSSSDSYSNASLRDMPIAEDFYAVKGSPEPNTAKTATTPTQAGATAANSAKNRSPSVKRLKTSPICVPGARRARHDSEVSVGSYHFVTSTGSIESDGSFMAKNADWHSLESNGKQPVHPPVSLRTKRLNEVRAILIQAYSRTAGLTFRGGSLTLAQYVTQMADFF